MLVICSYKWANNDLFLPIFRFFQTEKTEGFSGIWTQIVVFEGEQADQ